VFVFHLGFDKSFDASCPDDLATLGSLGFHVEVVDVGGRSHHHGGWFDDGNVHDVKKIK